jgi:hypothetical protein
MSQPLARGALVVALLGASVASAAKDDGWTVGVYLPSALSDGDARFRFGEELAAALEKKLGTKVAAKNFGRHEDLAAQASKGQLQLIVVDGWIAPLWAATYEPIALGELAGATHQPWAVIARSKTSLKQLNGKRLAVLKGKDGKEADFLSNVIFLGDLSAKPFKLTPVPNVESALRLLASSGAEATVVPLSHVPKDASVVYSSSPIPTAVVMRLKAAGDELDDAFPAVAPFTRFTQPKAGELEAFSKLLSKGPPKRQCVMATILRCPSKRPPWWTWAPSPRCPRPSSTTSKWRKGSRTHRPTPECASPRSPLRFCSPRAPSRCFRPPPSSTCSRSCAASRCLRTRPTATRMTRAPASWEESSSWTRGCPAAGRCPAAAAIRSRPSSSR